MNLIFLIGIMQDTSYKANRFLASVFGIGFWHRFLASVFTTFIPNVIIVKCPAECFRIRHHQQNFGIILDNILD
jgi:hypothetical protein